MKAGAPSDLLAEAECDLQTPLELRCPVEALQSVHAGLAAAVIHVAIAKHRVQGQLAAVVAVAQLQRQVARALEAEVPGQLALRLRTYNVSCVLQSR